MKVWKEQKKVINEIDNAQMINNSLINLEVEEVNSEDLQFSNDIYNQQTIMKVLNVLEPEQIIWLNQSFDELLVNNDISERNYRKYHL